MNRGQRPSYVCFDCGELTKATVQVYRLNPWPDGTVVRTATIVHRAGTGCHKGETPEQVREPR